MQLSYRWTAGATMGVFLFAVTLATQGQAQQQQQQGGQQAAPQGQQQGQGGRQGGGQAQGGARQGGGRGFTNLQVLPANMPAPQVIQLMQGFEAALGVTCEHCHVFFGQGNPMNNMASDDKQPKKTARVMMLAARDFQAKLTPADLGKQDAADVGAVMCGTCHRGKAIPDWVQPPPPARGGGAGGGGRQGGGN
ncbi:MAG: c-type cytochrome [Vicinamibacterales bacterium]